MMSTLRLTAMLFAGLGLAATGARAAETASATLKDPAGKIVGTALLRQTPSGTFVAVRFRGLPPYRRQGATDDMAPSQIKLRPGGASATGALLMVDETRGYPSQVTLEIPHSREALPGRIAWRGRNALGIEFDAAPGAVAAQLDNRWIEGSTARRGDRR